MKLIGVYEAAPRLGITPQTTYEWIRRGILTAYRDSVTQQLLLDLAEVERLAPDRRIRRVAVGGAGR